MPGCGAGAAAGGFGAPAPRALGQGAVRAAVAGVPRCEARAPERSSAEPEWILAAPRAHERAGRASFGTGGEWGERQTRFLLLLWKAKGASECLWLCLRLGGYVLLVRRGEPEEMQEGGRSAPVRGEAERPRATLGSAVCCGECSWCSREGTDGDALAAAACTEVGEKDARQGRVASYCRCCTAFSK